MGCKRGHKEPRKLPYGATRGRYWCFGCDKDIVPEWYHTSAKPIKRKERQKAKREIRKELKELDL